MSLRQIVLSPVWNDAWLAALGASVLLAGLLWRLGDVSGARGSLWVAATAIGALVATAAGNSLLRHLSVKGNE
jgi:hypothetical protein